MTQQPRLKALAPLRRIHTSFKQKLARQYLACGILLLSLPAVAAEDIATKPSAAILQMLLGLALVIGLIFALAWLSKRLGGALPGSNKAMKILAVLPVGTREKVVLVEVGGQQMMLGVTPSQINTLQVFNEPVIKNAPEASVRGLNHLANNKNLAARSASEFSRKLQEFMKQGNKT